MRLAIYAAPPPGDPLWSLGSRLIGYDAQTGMTLPFPERYPADEPTWLDWTADPRRYGLHATLKAPFRLAAGATLDDAAIAARDFAARTAPVAIRALSVELIGNFVALVPSEASASLEALAASCVETFEPFRAPLTKADRARRLKASLSARQMELLDRYGYPYVLDQFRFHMTLTGPLPCAEAEKVRSALATLYADCPPGLLIDALCIFTQDDPGSPFRIARRIPLLA